ncbi:MAG TPA: sigma-70 family RNA polymerase sigma factor [Elusimicrobiota bacterium]|nr:sigma-70 family RNA polymerase sigma factor [Elusimicrobiota bacterium]
MSEEELLKGHAATVYNLALRLTGNAADAEDLAQEALLKALKALPSFRGEAQASTWLYRITVNAWKNRVRAEKRRAFWKSVPLASLLMGGRDGEEDGAGDLKAADAPLDAGLEQEETSKAVQGALLELEEESRAVVVLREIEGLSYEQIAQTLGLPEGTVKSRLSRAREALKAKLKAFAKAG